MSTIRVTRRRRYTAVDRTTINEDRLRCVGKHGCGKVLLRAADGPCPCGGVEGQKLSFRARGILVWLLDKPDDWTTSSEALARAGGEGRDAIRSALSELEAFGYLHRERKQGKGGRWTTECTIYEVPPGPENPASVFPSSVDRTSVGQASSPTETENETNEQFSTGVVEHDDEPTPPPWVGTGMTWSEWIASGREATG